MHEIAVSEGLLARNAAAAQENRALFARSGTCVVNLMSGPGAGKTSILERTVAELKGQLTMAVIEGDVQGNEDAERIARCGVLTRQINTGGACHLDARQIQHELTHLDLEALDLLVIENVGNLVCPAEFDLGEHDKVMVLSVTEGHDKPSKYPVMFHRARALLVNKVDLLPHTNFDMDRAVREARAYNGDLDVMALSAATGEGFASWIAWLLKRVGSTAAP